MSTTQKSLQLLKSLVSAIRKREISNARKFLHRLLSDEPDLTEDIKYQTYDFGEAFRLFEDYAPFVSIIRKRISKSPSKFLYLLILEIMYNAYSEEQFDEVLQICNEALSLYPEEPDFPNMKSNVLSDLGQNKEALVNINKALYLQKNNTTFLSNKAMILYELGAKEKALETIERAIGIDPEYENLRDDKRFIEYEEEVRVQELTKEMKEVRKELKNVKVEFVTIAGLFVAILALVSKTISFDYNQIQEKTYFEIFWTQLATNSAWIITIIMILLFILWFNVIILNRKPKKQITNK